MCSGQSHGREDQVSRETGRCCQCRRKGGRRQQGEDKCRECWWASLDKQRFEGVVIDRRNKVNRLLILEFKRRSDTREEYWQEGMRESKEQYEDLCRGIMECVRDGWECCFVPIVAGTKSMKEEAWNWSLAGWSVILAPILLRGFWLCGWSQSFFQMSVQDDVCDDYERDRDQECKSSSNSATVVCGTCGWS